MSFLLKRTSFTSFTASFTTSCGGGGGGGGGGGRFARRRLTTFDGSKEKKSLRSINYTNLLLVTKETALAKYASLFASLGGGDSPDDERSSKVRWDRLKVRHDAHENAVAKGARF
tara:strand:- start:73 stop:417 length:345 start_codon:yes stop_codon:yes gene_type:complete